MILLPNACWLGNVWCIGERNPGVARTKSCPVGRTKSALSADEIHSCGVDGGVSSVGILDVEFLILNVLSSCAALLRREFGTTNQPLNGG